MLRPTHRTRERILAMGSYGVGKSYAWLSIAKKAQETGSPAKFYCLDTDDAIQRMLDEEFTDLSNVVLYRVFDWPDYEQALAESVHTVETRLAEQDGRMYDWVIVDLIDLAWEAVQSYFVEQVHNQGIGEYFLEVRKALKGNRLDVFDGWRDWGVINKVYTSWINQLIYKVPAHIFAATKIEPVSTKTDSSETLNLFGQYGVKPKGQKNLGHQFHTVMLFSCLKVGDWRVTTVKERAGSVRKPFTGQSLKDFSIQYLVAKAGWEL